MKVNRILLGAGLLLTLGATVAMAETINGCNLQPGTQCPGANLRNAQINGADLSRANLAGAHFDGAQIGNNTRFTDANLNGAFFTNAVIAFVYLDNIRATNANFDGVAMSLSGSRDMDFSGASFRQANGPARVGLTFSGGVLRFGSAKLNGAQVVITPQGGDPRNIDFSGADLSGATLNGRFAGSNFRNAIVTGLKFGSDADLSGATWSDGRKCGDNSIGMCRLPLSGADLVKLLQGLPAAQQDLVLQHYPQFDAAQRKDLIDGLANPLGAALVASRLDQLSADSRQTLADLIAQAQAGKLGPVTTAAPPIPAPTTSPATVATKPPIDSASAVPGRIEGLLEAADCLTIRGWAWNSAQPTTPQRVDIYSDGTIFQVGLIANGARPDLQSAGKGDGHHGFSIATPEALKDGKNHDISLRLNGTPLTLPETRHLTCLAPGASPRTIGLLASLLTDMAREGHLAALELRGPAADFNPEVIVLAKALPPGELLKQALVKTIAEKLGRGQTGEQSVQQVIDTYQAARVAWNTAHPTGTVSTAPNNSGSVVCTNCGSLVNGGGKPNPATLNTVAQSNLGKEDPNQPTSINQSDALLLNALKDPSNVLPQSSSATLANTGIQVPAGGRLIRITNYCQDQYSVAVKNETTGQYYSFADGKPDAVLNPNESRTIAVSGGPNATYIVHQSGLITVNARIAGPTDEAIWFRARSQCGLISGPAAALQFMTRALAAPQVVTVSNRCGISRRIAIKNTDTDDYQPLEGGSNTDIPNGATKSLPVYGTKFRAHLVLGGVNRIDLGTDFQLSAKLALVANGTDLDQLPICQLQVDTNGQPGDAPKSQFRISNLRNPSPQAIAVNYARIMEIYAAGSTPTDTEKKQLDGLVAYIRQNRLDAAKAALYGFDKWSFLAAKNNYACLPECSSADLVAWINSSNHFNTGADGQPLLPTHCIFNRPDDPRSKAESVQVDGQRSWCSWQPKVPRARGDLQNLFDTDAQNNPPDDFKNLALSGTTAGQAQVGPLLKALSVPLGTLATGGTLTGLAYAAPASVQAILAQVTPFAVRGGVEAASVAVSAAGVVTVAATVVTAIATPMMMTLIKRSSYRPDLEKLVDSYAQSNYDLGAAVGTPEGRNYVLMMLALYTGN